MSEEMKKQEAPAVKAKKASPLQEHTAENYVYIGPNRLADGLKCYTVYRGYPHEIVEMAKEKYEDIARLFVPVEELGAAMAEVAQMGTPLYLAALEVGRGE